MSFPRSLLLVSALLAVACADPTIYFIAQINGTCPLSAATTAPGEPWQVLLGLDECRPVNAAGSVVFTKLACAGSGSATILFFHDPHCTAPFLAKFTDPLLTDGTCHTSHVVFPDTVRIRAVHTLSLLVVFSHFPLCLPVVQEPVLAVPLAFEAECGRPGAIAPPAAFIRNPGALVLFKTAASNSSDSACVAAHDAVEYLPVGAPLDCQEHEDEVAAVACLPDGSVALSACEPTPINFTLPAPAEPYTCRVFDSMPNLFKPFGYVSYCPKH